MIKKIAPLVVLASGISALFINDIAPQATEPMNTDSVLQSSATFKGKSNLFECNHAHSATEQYDCSNQSNFLKEIFEKNNSHQVFLSDIPESPFKKDLVALGNQKIQDKAIANLIRLNPPKLDLNSIRVHSSGNLYYTCSAKALNSEEAREYTPKVGEATVSIDNPPELSSKPGAPNTIYLDFNGESVSGTAWNSDATVWECTAYDFDGDNTTFSDTEQDYIRTAWAKVAEDYAPFDVNVTTVRPDVFDETVSHALITPDTDANGETLPHAGSGGIAYVGVFGEVGNENFLINWNQPYAGTTVAEVISHEVGHNMGLSHDGDSLNEYYDGHGTGDTSWGPIMGASYGMSLTQFSKGEYFDANNSQDDLAILAGRLTYKTDDHSDDTTSALSLSHTDGTISDSGLIETTSDTDIFIFAAKVGSATFNVESFNEPVSGDGGNNLDVKIELLDDEGNSLASNAPTDSTDASITFDIPEVAAYYLVVTSDSVSGYDTNPAVGYSTYGSLGEYSISGSFTPADNLPPELTVAATASPSILNEGESTYLSVSASDPEDAILAYTWSKTSGPGTVTFSDASASTTNATFSSGGNYELTVTISDGEYSINSSVSVVVLRDIVSETLAFDDVVQTDAGTWNSVALSKSYSDPVIIFSSLTTNNEEAGNIRVRNVTATSFEWQLDEWDYLDGSHEAEQVKFIILESGTYTLADGRQFVAGNVSATDGFTTHSFPTSFSGTPTVVTQVRSENDSKAVVSRLNNISAVNFAVKLQNEESNSDGHATETVSYIAVEPGVYTGNNFLLEANYTDREVTDSWFGLYYQSFYTEVPTIFTSIQTYNEEDPVSIRINNFSGIKVDLKLQEEASYDTETEHYLESIGYILMDLD